MMLAFPPFRIDLDEERLSTGATLVGQVLIDALRLSGHAAEARAITDEIIAFAIARNESVYLPELIRIRGEQLGDREGAGRDDREAIERARSTGAVSLERRATESLAALAGR